MNGIFDSHAHYDDERFDADRDELLQRIHREGVEYIMTIGADLPTSYAARELAERYDFVYFAAGIHPEQAGDAPENYLEELKALAAHPKCRAIGLILGVIISAPATSSFIRPHISSVYVE